MNYLDEPEREPGNPSCGGRRDQGRRQLLSGHSCRRRVRPLAQTCLDATEGEPDQTTPLRARGAAKSCRCRPQRAHYVADGCTKRVVTHFYSIFSASRVASQHGQGHKSGQLKGFPLPHRTVIAAIQSPAKAAADLRMLLLGALLLLVSLIPLSRAVWMPAT